MVIRPSTMPNSSFMTLAKGARQFVVQEALDTTFRSCNQSISKPDRDVHAVISATGGRETEGTHTLVYFSWFTPHTNMGASAEGAEMITCHNYIHTHRYTVTGVHRIEHMHDEPLKGTMRGTQGFAYRGSILCT